MKWVLLAIVVVFGVIMGAAVIVSNTNNEELLEMTQSHIEQRVEQHQSRAQSNEPPVKFKDVFVRLLIVLALGVGLLIVLIVFKRRFKIED